MSESPPEDGPEPPSPEDGLEYRPSEESPEAARARRLRNWLLAGALFAFAVLFYVVTIVHQGGHVFE